MNASASPELARFEHSDPVIMVSYFETPMHFWSGVHTPTSSDLETPMRHARTSFRLAAFLTAVTALACASAETGESPDSAASAAAAAPPPPESFTLVANDGSWSGDITPAGVVFRHKRNDSLMFDYKPPTVNGAISDYDLLHTGTDTVRLTVSLAMTNCTDKAGKTYTHLAQVYLTGDVQMQSSGCASKK
ncbi:MAG TPA: hypothetical protein VFZ73_07250 [Gemmatimonadaceae bacterium]